MTAPDWRERLAAIMQAAAGPLRDGRHLRQGQRDLAAWPLQAAPDDAEGLTAANAALVARLIVTAALAREESRGGHFRADFPEQREQWRTHTVQVNGCPPTTAASVAPPPPVANAAD